MKDSGIPWIREIPEEWKICRFKNTHNGTNVGEGIDKQFWCDDNNMTPFYSASITPLHTNYKFFPDWKYTTHRDLLLSRNGTPYVYLPVTHAAYTDHIIRVSINEKFDRRFVKYSIEQGIRSMAVNTVSLATWSASVWNEQRLAFPPLIDQIKIASYLDEKCSEIDELIDVEQKMIDELEAYRKALITETVTKGLNTGVSMRETDIPWAPLIPAHWKVCRLKDLCQKMQAGDVLTSMQINPQGEYLVYGGNGVRGYYDKSNFTGEAILIGRQGALAGNVHYINGSIWATDHAVVTIPSSISEVKYLYYLTIGMNLNQYAFLTAAQPGLAVGQIKNIITINPPLSEQQAIADYLDTKCKEIDDLVAVKREKMETLKQYRQSIIFEAVTGKIQVC